MELPHLSSLELVYLVDEGCSDDDLLQYVAASYPDLSHLEIHRYRADRTEQVDYVSTVCKHDWLVLTSHIRRILHMC